jgi:MFS family permease
MIATNVGLVYLDESWGRPLMITGYGIQGGMARLLSSVTWPRYYGRRHLGAIRSYAVAFGVAASALGPTLFGLSADWFGTYHIAAWACIIVLVILLPLAPLARESSIGKTKE